jgi:hypothetical protein
LDEISKVAGNFGKLQKVCQELSGKNLRYAGAYDRKAPLIFMRRMSGDGSLGLLPQRGSGVRVMRWHFLHYVRQRTPS